MAWLYRFEAKSIQQYVLGSQKLKEILGASAVVQALSDELIPAVLARTGGSVLYSAAGGATLRFETEASLRDFVPRITVEAARFAPGLPTVQAWTRDGEGAVAELQRRLRHARNVQPFAVPIGNAVIDRSPDGWPALPKTDHDDRQLDLVRRAKLHAHDHFLRPLEKRFFAARAAELEAPREIDDIAGRGEARYVAVIHADGNGVGQLLPALTTAEKMGAFSSALAEATLAAVHRASDELFDVDNRLCGRPVVVGGDDVTVIVAAGRATAWVQAFCAAFEEETQARGQINGRQGLTASAGIALVRSKHPFRQAYDLAEALCSYAKREGRAAGSPSLVAFKRVSNTLDADLPAPVSGAESRHRFGPYLVGASAQTGFARLDAVRAAAHAAARRDVARGPLRTLAQRLTARPESAARHFERLCVVHSESRGFSLLRQRLADLAEGLDTELYVPVRRATATGTLADVTATPWFDILDLMAVEGTGGTR